MVPGRRAARAAAARAAAACDAIMARVGVCGPCRRAARAAAARAAAACDALIMRVRVCGPCRRAARAAAARAAAACALCCPRLSSCRASRAEGEVGLGQGNTGRGAPRWHASGAAPEPRGGRTRIEQCAEEVPRLGLSTGTASPALSYMHLVCCGSRDEAAHALEWRKSCICLV